jgi:hypothetical protein
MMHAKGAKKRLIYKQNRTAKQEENALYLWAFTRHFSPKKRTSRFEMVTPLKKSDFIFFSFFSDSMLTSQTTFYDL